MAGTDSDYSVIRGCCLQPENHVWPLSQQQHVYNPLLPQISKALATLTGDESPSTSNRVHVVTGA